jgi:translation initiation factor IF-1
MGAHKTVARVLEELPHAVYRVEVTKNRRQVLAHAVGTEKRNFVRLLPGDRVEVDVSPHDPTRGRILRKIVNESSRIGKEDL